MELSSSAENGVSIRITGKKDKKIIEKGTLCSNETKVDFSWGQREITICCRPNLSWCWEKQSGDSFMPWKRFILSRTGKRARLVEHEEKYREILEGTCLSFVQV